MQAQRSPAVAGGARRFRLEDDSASVFGGGFHAVELVAAASRGTAAGRDYRVVIAFVIPSNTSSEN